MRFMKLTLVITLEQSTLLIHAVLTYNNPMGIFRYIFIAIVDRVTLAWPYAQIQP